jgi:hypothetical protein
MRVLTIILISVHAFVNAQNSIKEIKPSEIQPLNLSNEAAARFEKDREVFVTISNKLNDGAKVQDLSADERRVWNETDETMEDYWDIIGGGCSWYCGGGPKEVTASSELQSQGANSYKAENAHDLSYRTAWVEGVAGYGLGEFIFYTFSPESPRITDIIVVNGYVKSEKAYLDNARVKKLKVWLNDKPLAILYLEDKRSKQVFKFEPIGNGNRQNPEALKVQPGWTLRFEILEVYKGLKYEDTAITEVYFNGIDVH